MATEWTKEYDTAQIVGSKSPTLIDNQSRDDKVAIQERMNDGVDTAGNIQTDAGDHFWPKTGSQVSNKNASQHRKLTLREQASDPAKITGAVVTYSKDVDGKPELHSIDEDGNVTQLISVGAINAGAITVTQRPTSAAGGAADIEFTGAIDAWTDITGMTLTFTTTGGDVFLSFNAMIEAKTTSDSYARIYFRILLDDVEQYQTGITVDPMSSYASHIPLSFQFLCQSLAAAEHTWKIQYSRKKSTWRQKGGDQKGYLTAIEFKA